MCGESKKYARQFATNTKFCNACYGSTQTQTCNVCREKKSTKEFRKHNLDHAKKHGRRARCDECHTCVSCKVVQKDGREFEDASRTCRRCADTAICEACKESKSRTDFDAGVWEHARKHLWNLRCKACHTCTKCHVRQRDGRSFEERTRTCRRCSAKEELAACDVCEEEKPRSSYERSVWENSRKYGRSLRCIACHTCIKCGMKQKDGHSFEECSRTCGTCKRRDEMAVCNACGKSQPRIEYDDNVWSNAQKHGRNLVCTTCFTLGFTPKDVITYRCKNGCERGHMHFDRKALKNHKSRGSRVTCAQCEKTEAEEKARDEAREKDIKQRLKRGWKCTCNKLVHTEKCQLFPGHAGERRWPGSNTGVTKSDLEFLAKRQRRQ